MTEIDKPQEAKVEAAKDGSIKVAPPKGRKHRGVTVLLETDDVLRAQAGSFSKFLQEYAVIGLALGFIVGQPANAVVKQFADTFINPWIQILFGQNLSSRVATFHHGTQPVKVPWGGFVYALLEFFIVLIIIYAAIKVFKLGRFIKKPEEKK